MKCDCCGTENGEGSVWCNGCGAALIPSEETREHKAAGTAAASAVPQLDARWATKVLAIVWGASVLGGLIFGAIGVVVFKAQGVAHPIGVVATVVAGVAMVLASRSLPREVLKDGSPLGAAWVVGPKKQIVQAMGLGALLGLAITVLLEHQGGRHGAPFDPMMTLVTIALAPPVEEMLFRGLLYGGYRRSFGKNWAAVLTTSLFFLPHAPRSVLSAVGIAGVALTALWFRLRSSAIGPAIASHSGYNAARAAVFFFHPI